MGVCYISMLNRTNILALILKNTQKDCKNEQTLLIWDDNHNKKIGEIEFNKKIKNNLNTKRFYYCFSNKCYLYISFTFIRIVYKKLKQLLI